ncbi:MAG TPA: ribonuclease P protein component [Aeromicrobium sp.]|nr:ribonuclease P protein component [Aeromicrobium sp.]
MLPRDQRMTGSDEFSSTVRSGVRSAQPALVAHVVLGTNGGSTRVGFVVSRAVGDAVTRNRVKRRLRHLMRDRLDAVPAGSRVVIRALPSAADHESSDLGTQLDAALRRCGAR